MEVNGAILLTLKYLATKCKKKKGCVKGIVHFENKSLICFSLPQGHPRCRCLCFHSIFNFWSNRFWSNRVMETYGVHLKEHAQRSPN